MNTYTADDFICIKELPESGTILLSSLDFNIDKEDLLMLIKNSLGEKFVIDDYQSAYFKYFHISCITWGYANLKKQAVWFSAIDHDDTIKYYDYFKISDTSKMRGIFHSKNFSI